MLSIVNGKKKVSDASEPTQPDHSRRFVRRNSYHTLNCRSGSLNKNSANQQQLYTSTSHQFTTQAAQQIKKKDILNSQTDTFFKDFASPFGNSVKRVSGSMKIDSKNPQKRNQMQKFQSLKRQVSIRLQQINLLESQCKKLKILVKQQRQKRKTLQQQSRCHKIQIKRLEKRLLKYEVEKQKSQKDKQMIISHIQEIQKLKFNQQTMMSHNYKLKVIEGEVLTLRKQLQKNRSQREKQLIVELQKMIAGKFTVENQLKSALISNTILSKQFEQAMEEMEEVRESIHKTVSSSYEYIQLRERYRKMLVSYKELQDQMSILEHAYNNKTIQNTILTVSQHSSGLSQQ